MGETSSRSSPTCARIVIAGTALRPAAADLYIFRYSNIAGWVDIAEKGPFRSVVFDEVQELRTGTRTQKGQAASVFARAAARLRMGLSATPIYNHGDEIFPIVDLIEPGALGDVYEFRREWCVRAGRSGWWPIPTRSAPTCASNTSSCAGPGRAGRFNTLVHEVAYDEKVAARPRTWRRRSRSRW